MELNIIDYISKYRFLKFYLLNYYYFVFLIEAKFAARFGACVSNSMSRADVNREGTTMEIWPSQLFFGVIPAEFYSFLLYLFFFCFFLYFCKFV